MHVTMNSRKSRLPGSLARLTLRFSWKRLPLCGALVLFAAVAFGCHDSRSKVPSEANKALQKPTPAHSAPPADVTVARPQNSAADQDSKPSSDPVAASKEQIDQEVKRLAKSDPAKAFALIDASFPRDKAMAMKFALLRTLCEEDFTRLSALLPFLTDRSTRASALRDLSNYWAGHDARGFVDYAAANLNAVDRQAVYSSIVGAFAKLAKFDDATEIMGKLEPGSPQRLDAIRSVTRDWAKSDSQATVRWMLTLPAKDQATAMSSLYGAALQPKDVDALLALCEGVTDVNIQNNSIGCAVRILVTSGDLPGAKAWIQQLPAGLQGAAQTSLITYDHTDSVADLAPLAFAIQGQMARDSACSTLVKRVFAQNPSDAANWVLQMPQSVRTIGVQTVTVEWYNTDPDSALQWLTSLPKGDLKNTGLKVFASVANINNPDAAKMALRYVGK